MKLFEKCCSNPRRIIVSPVIGFKCANCGHEEIDYEVVHIGDCQNSRWTWMMDYCKSRGLSPAHDWAWSKAENAWREHNAHNTQN